jgi:adenylylsulfate kinase
VTATATPPPAASEGTNAPTTTTDHTSATDHNGATVWLTGLPSAGKTTIARAVAEVLRSGGHRVEVLDGDAVRETLSAGLGFSRADRETNIDRIGYVADLLARNGVLVLASVISPYAAARDRVRARHASSATPFFEVYVATPVRECAARDVKGLYARQAAGDLVGLTGVDDVYEPPPAADLTLDTRDRTVADTAAAVLDLLRRKGILH